MMPDTPPAGIILGPPVTLDTLGRFAAPPDAMRLFVLSLGLPQPEAERITNRYNARYDDGSAPE